MFYFMAFLAIAKKFNNKDFWFEVFAYWRIQKEKFNAFIELTVTIEYLEQGRSPM